MTIAPNCPAHARPYPCPYETTISLRVVIDLKPVMATVAEASDVDNAPPPICGHRSDVLLE